MEVVATAQVGFLSHWNNWRVCGLDQRCCRRTATRSVRSAKKRFCQSRRIGEPARESFTQSGSKRSDARGTMRLFHGGPAKAGVSDVRHANFQQFSRLSWLEETRLLLSMERGPASCAGHAKTQDARTSLGRSVRRHIPREQLRRR